MTKYIRPLYDNIPSYSIGDAANIDTDTVENNTEIWVVQYGIFKLFKNTSGTILTGSATHNSTILAPNKKDVWVCQDLLPFISNNLKQLYECQPNPVIYFSGSILDTQLIPVIHNNPTQYQVSASGSREINMGNSLFLTLYDSRFREDQLFNLQIFSVSTSASDISPKLITVYNNYCILQFVNSPGTIKLCYIAGESLV